MRTLMEETMGRLGRQESRREHGRAVDDDDDEAVAERVAGESGQELKLSLRNLLIINEYCSSLMDQLDDKR